MANLNRIQLLLGYINEDQNDPFNYYALALEYLSEDKNRAKEYFELLLNRFPSYLPTYFHAAACFIELQDYTMAGQIYKKGISLAQQQGDHHAEKELKNAYLNFQLEYED